MTPLKPSHPLQPSNPTTSDPATSTSSPSFTFPLSSIVAIAGSRYGSPYPIAPIIKAIHQAGGSIRVGCAKGVDQTVSNLDPSCMVFSVHGYLPANYSVALALRTRGVVEKANALILYPPANNTLGPGSYLALTIAIEHNLPVFCAGITPTKAKWQPFALAGVTGYLLLPQNTLFST